MERDDQLLLLTRCAFWAIVLVTTPAFIILWGFPSDTGDLWAWQIDAAMTPIVMGSVYGAGAFYFATALLGRRWVPVSAGTLAAVVFAAAMLATTVRHWDKFNHGDAPALGALAFYLWTGLYLLSPFIVLAVWWRNRRTDPGVQASDLLVGRAARTIAGLAAASAIIFGAAMLLSPASFLASWPWPLTPLTARVLGCFAVQLGVGLVVLAGDPRWRAWKLLLTTVILANTLMLVGMLRVWDTFNDEGARLGLAASFAAGIVAVGAYVMVMSHRAKSVA